MSSSNKKRTVRTLEPLNAFDRDKRMWEIRNSYSRGQRPSQPKTRHELDILKERHQFVRSSEIDPSNLDWEDQLAAKYYDSLFKEFAIVNLKHWRSGQIGLRWRTEDEVLTGKGHRTCASMRCQYHEPDPQIVVLEEEEEIIDPDSSKPLVKTRLEESEMNFGYVENGEKKTTLVKVVLCRECGKRLKRGKEKAKEERQKLSGAITASKKEVDDDLVRERVERGRGEASRKGSRSEDDDRGERRKQRRSRSPERREDDSEEDYTPSLPPDIERARSSSTPHSHSHSRRRSASPASRHR